GEQRRPSAWAWGRCARRPAGECAGIDTQTAAAGTVHHPAQRDIADLMVQVAAADIAVHAGKPHLFELLTVRNGLLGPQRGLERTALLVDRQCLESGVDGGAQVGVVELPAS